MAKIPTSQRGLYKRGDTYYSRIAGQDGKLIRRRLSADKQTALIMLAEMRKQLELQKVGILPDTFEEEIKSCVILKQRYLNHLRSRGRSSATLDSFALSWKLAVEENQISFTYGITLGKMEEWVLKLRKSGTRGQTINHYIGMVKRALAWAYNNGYMHRNPLAKWEGVRKDSPRKRRDLLPEEWVKFFEAETDPLFRLRWLVYFHTGLRASAGKSIEWEWIVWDNKELFLPAAANKSGRDHRIPLSETLLGALKEYRARLPEGTVTGPIFPGAEVHQIRSRFKQICKAAGIDTEGLCLHSIRHTVATAIYNATGGNLKAVTEILGHADAATTMKYLHVTKEVKQVGISALEQQFGNGA